MTTEKRFSNHQRRTGTTGWKHNKCQHKKPTGDRKTSEMRRQQTQDDTFVRPKPVVDEEEKIEQEKSSTNITKTLEGPKHIRPCICDLTKQQRARIKAHLDARHSLHVKYAKRLKEIEEELERLEAERLEREQELEEQESLFGDLYEMVGKKKKRKKRSARRASMVSLGVKQIINWRKPPRHQVKMNKTSNLRKEYTSYCGIIEHPESPFGEVDYRKEPIIPIRTTLSFELRSKVNLIRKNELIKREDNRRPFITCF